MTYQDQKKRYLDLINSKMEALLPQEDLLQKELINSMRYSLLDGGKRVRPMLTLAFCELCGGKAEDAVPFACAIEMIHAYSLIHDDLPCMDNANMRRGKLSNHMVFSEDIALLAGDGLLTLAFETALSPEAEELTGLERAAKAAHLLAQAAGLHGMVGGQAIDLMSEGKSITLEELKHMDELKTGALIRVAAKMGCVAAGADDAQIQAADQYAEAIGLSFQIVDDILDVTSDTQVLGKPAGIDTINEKCTYVSLMGMEEAGKAVMELTDSAIESLQAFSGDTSYLVEFAKALAARNK